MGSRVGVVCVQGDFEKHIEALVRSGLRDETIVRIAQPEHLKGITHAILPGGESTTVGLLFQRYGLGDALRQAVADGMALWGTCMGMIMMATHVEGRDQYKLGVLDVTVRRNAYGAQVHSFEDEVAVKGLEEPVTGVFIRAPVVTRLGSQVEELARYQGEVVAVRQGRLVGTSFHPELTEDTRFHEWFTSLQG